MIEGKAVPSLELLAEGHEEEQECLFYVGMSRAKVRLFLYAPTKKANGHKRSLSPYLSRLAPDIEEVDAVASRALPADDANENIKLVVDGGLKFRGEQLKLYDK
jgi:superfamily I DNA/RNA helicase